MTADLLAILHQLDEARAKATPGPWVVDKNGWIDAGKYDTVIGPGDVDCMAHCYGGRSRIEGDNLPADAALIVAAVNAAPKLTAALRAVLAMADRMEAEAADRLRTVDRLPDQPAYRMEINRLVVAAEHQRRCAKQVRAAITAALTPEATS